MNTDHVENNASTVRQQFQGDEMTVQHETASVAIAAAAKATIEARYIIAMKRPRDLDVVRQKLLKECERPGFAEAAIFRKPLGSKFNDETGKWEKQYAEGLSVRFAEAAKRCLTNIYWSAVSIYDDQEKSVVRVTVMDLESNDTGETDIHVSKTVERSKLKEGQRPLAERVNSGGKKVYVVPATDDEILNKVNALISKAFRNNLLRIVPGDIQDECEEKCRATQADRDKKDPGAAKKKLFDAFAGIGVMPDALKEYLGHPNDLAPSELAELRAIFSAIRDGETTWAAIVDAKSPAEGTEKNGAAQKKVEDLIDKHKTKQAAKGKGDEKDKAQAKTPEGSAGTPSETPAQGQPTEPKTEAKQGREPGQD